MFGMNFNASDIITLSIKRFCILNAYARVMTVYENYNVIAFKPCIQIFTVQGVDIVFPDPQGM